MTRENEKYKDAGPWPAERRDSRGKFASPVIDGHLIY